MSVVRFRIARLRPGLLAEILEVWGHAGVWPLRRRMHYLAGGNCDEIRAEGGKLLVLRGTCVIAEGSYAARRGRGRKTPDPGWEDLLQPGRRRGR